ncbi:unnamed protein product [Sphenostylis stenocarpa]|uniref:Uncharacterized protein n=1 Tax=Sphenostylis stenocarpa TaxID=92480 RepID=A0AA86VL65_9FABA|nr:unnamed protein product [Sphenostylis stenocarpa]
MGDSRYIHQCIGQNYLHFVTFSSSHCQPLLDLQKHLSWIQKNGSHPRRRLLYPGEMLLKVQQWLTV